MTESFYERPDYFAVVHTPYNLNNSKLSFKKFYKDLIDLSCL